MDSKSEDTDIRLNELCAQYQCADSKEARDAVFGKMLPLCKRMGEHLAEIAERRYTSRTNGIYADNFHDAIPDTLQHLLNHSNTRATSFANLFAVALQNKFRDINRRIHGMHQIRTINIPPDESAEMTRDDILGNRDYQGESYGIHTPVVQDEPFAAEQKIKITNDIAKVLGSLSEKLLEAYILYLENIPYEKIAETLAIPQGTVKSRIHRVNETLDTLGYTTRRDFSELSSTSVLEMDIMPVLKELLKTKKIAHRTSMGA